jgi:PAS domain S-box-containing protein
MATLLLGLVCKRISAGTSITGSALESLGFTLSLHMPWTLSVLWLLYGGHGYALLLSCLCGLLLPDHFNGRQWFSEPLGIVVLTGIVAGFPFDTRLRSLPAIALFGLGCSCAAAAGSMGIVYFGGEEALTRWEPLWLTQLFQDLFVTAPLAFLAGPYVEQTKARFFGTLPERPPTVRQQFLGVLLALVTLLAFSITWTVAADLPIHQTIRQFVTDPQVIHRLNEAQQSTALRKAALVAILLGAVSGGASLVILFIRKYREDLREEVRQGTESLRHNQLLLQALQQVSEAANRSLDPEVVLRDLAQTLARMTGAAQIAIYTPDPSDADMLKLVESAAIRPALFEHPQRLSLHNSLAGQACRTGSIVETPENLPVYVEDEALRTQFAAAKLEALLAIPIVGEYRTLGVASMMFDSRYAPEPEDHRLFRLIGRTIGAALERAETHAKARRYAGDLGGLYRFSQQLAGESDEQALLAVAVPSARRLLGAQTVAMFLAPNTPGPPAADSATSAAVRLHCVACDGPADKLGMIRALSIPLNGTGLIPEAVREVRTTGGGIRNQTESALLCDGWAERSALVSPLPTASLEYGAVGAFVWTFDARSPIGLEEAGLAEEITRQIAAGLRRARLIEKTRQQAAELKLLEQIGRSLSMRLAMSYALEQTVQNVHKIVSARWATVLVSDAAEQVLRARATNLPQSGAHEMVLPLNGKSLAVACLKEGRTLVSADVLNDPRCDVQLAREFELASAICVPLGPPGQRFGVLMVNNSTAGEFLPDDVRRLEQVGQLATAAIERAKLYEEACQRADELILLNEVGHLLAESPALESTLQRIAELVCRNFALDGAGFLILNESRDALLSRGIAGEHSPAVKQLRVPISARDVTALAFRQNQPLVIDDARTDKRVHRMLLKLLPGARCGAVIPLTAASGALGILGIWHARTRALQPREIQGMAGVARLAAAAVARDELGQALHASEKRLQQVVDGLHAMIVSIDRHGNVLSFNAAAERVSGLSRTEVFGRPLASIVNPSLAQKLKLEQSILHAFTEEDCSKELLLNWATPNGGERKIRWSSSFLRGPDGKPTGMVCLGIDITGQILLEAQLLQAQKMESVGALAGGLAHDFNNLLGGIIGQCALARAQSSEPGAHLGKIEAAAQRGADLTSKLLTFARKSVLQPRPVDISALIKETSELLAGSLPRAIEVATNVAESLPCVHGDATQLQQVLLNLCVNARDAMPEGGTLTLSASTTLFTGSADSEGAPVITDIPPGVLIEISDTGTGMAEDVQQHLFEPFFTTKEPGKGTGLGLSVVFGIVRSHGGQIACHSQPGQGTRFSIRLPGTKPSSSLGRPLSGAPGESDAKLPLVQPGTTEISGTETVLLVDDDSILRDTMRQLLSSLGYDVRTASGGIEMLKQLDVAPRLKPAILLLDVIMPGLSGLPLFREFRKRHPGVPVILISGYSADQTVRDLLDAGALELVQKPFTLECLAGAMRRALTTASATKAES